MNGHEDLTNQRLNRETALKIPITLQDLQTIYELLNKELQFFKNCILCIPVEHGPDTEWGQVQAIIRSIVDIVEDTRFYVNICV